MTKRYVDTRKDLVVRKSETIVKARYRLSPLAIKFISVVIANLKRSDDLNQEYVVRVKDFQELTGQKTKRIYELIDEALENLLTNPITIPLDDEKNTVLKANWVSGAIYNDGEVRFMIYPKLRPFLLEFKEKYLTYKIENILSLRGDYTVRMYEILKNWLETNKRYGRKKVEKIISVSELREILEVTKGYPYGGSSGIKARIIEKAKQELTEKTDITFEYEEIKTGRKVTHLKFFVFDNPKGGRKLRSNKKKSITTETVVLRIPNEVRDKLKQVTNELLRKIERYIAEKGLEYVMSNIEYANRNAKDNYAGYLLNALKNDWAKNVREKQETQSKLEKAREEYKEFIGLEFEYEGKIYHVEDSSIYCYNTNSAWALGDVLEKWDIWQPFLKEKAAEAAKNTDDSTQGNSIDRGKELQERLI